MSTYIEHTDLSRPVYEKLKSMILSNELKPGQKILQEKIATQLGVSRTPLLKALQMLEYEYLVESIPRRGVFVKVIDFKEMIDVFDCREGIESVAVRLIASKADRVNIVNELEALFEPFVLNSDKININDYRDADEVFHKKLVQRSGNPILDRIFIYGNIHSRVIQMGLVRPPEETLSEHLNVLQAIKDGDVQKAEFEMKQHIRKSRDMIAGYKL